jgi:hypothetical protein
MSRADRSSYKRVAPVSEETKKRSYLRQVNNILETAPGINGLTSKKQLCLKRQKEENAQPRAKSVFIATMAVFILPI